MFLRGIYLFIHRNHSGLRQTVGALLCLVLLSLCACETPSSSVQTRSGPAETPATHTTRHSITIVNHKTTIGMDISAFLATYGKPLAGSEPKKGYHFSIYGDRTHDDPPFYDLTAMVAWSSPAPDTSRVNALWLSAPKGIIWDEATAIKQCLALVPADTVYKGQKNLPSRFIERTYESPTLAKQLGKTLFSDQKGHLVMPGTLYLALQKDSANHIFACTDQTEEFF